MVKKILTLLCAFALSIPMWGAMAYVKLANGSTTAMGKIGAGASSSWPSTSATTSASVTHSGAIRINAEAINGATFVGWYKDAAATQLLSTSAQYYWNPCPTTFGTTAYAKFLGASTVTITVSVDGSCTGMGTVNGTGTYDKGDDVEISASANSGYYFVEWNDGDKNNPRTISNVQSDATYTATFAAGVVPPNYVDLGLPSGTLWADRNIGAASESEVGNYFAWGATSKMTTYNSNYRYSGSYVQMDPKDNNGNTYSTLPVSNDAAAVVLGTGWHMPTVKEYEELIEYCDYSNTNSGVRFTNKSDPSKSIFIPNSGRMESSVKSSSEVYVWTNALESSSTYLQNAYAMNRYTSNLTKLQNASKYGLPIRAVYVPSGTKITATFKNGDATYDTKSVDKYSQPAAPSTNPTKESTNTTIYTFSKWTPALSKISVPTTYTAVFNSSTRYYTVNFAVDGGKGTLNKSSYTQYTYNSYASAAGVTVTPNAGYVLDHWQNGATTIDLSTFQVNADNITLTAYCTKQYVGADNGNWSVAANWNTNEVPTSSTDVSLIDNVYQDATKNGVNKSFVSKTAPSGTIDLGLSVYWADKNLGAEKTSDKGNYYAWGYTKDKSKSGAISSSNYAYASKNPTVLPVEDDAASAALGAGWRMPTKAEWTALKTACTWTWSSTNGLTGTKGTKTITLPKAGYYSYTSFTSTDCRYWASTNGSSYTGSNKSPDCFSASSKTPSVTTSNCYYAFSIRPVYDTTSYKLTIKTSGADKKYNNVYSCQYGQKLTITAVPSTGYKFSKWNDGNTDNPRTFVVSANAEYTATFVTLPEETIIVNQAQANDTTIALVPQGDASAVDLGLSVQWANKNVGATKVEDYGSYFAWGETAEKSSYKSSASDYPAYTITKNLTADNDAATVQMGEEWRMPTQAEWQELLNGCTLTKKTQNKVNGYLVRSNTTGDSIFLPMAGYKSSVTNDQGKAARYWTSTYGTGTQPSSKTSYAFSDLTGLNVTKDLCYGYYGYSVRAVSTTATATTLTIRINSVVYKIVCGQGQKVTVTAQARQGESFVRWSDGNTTNPRTFTMNTSLSLSAEFTGSSVTPVPEDQTIHQDDADNTGTTKDMTEGVETPTEVAPANAIDLGLSVLWADANVGATKNDTYGSFYAWAETATKTSYTWENYTYSQGNTDKVTKYAIKGGYAGFKDNLTQLEDADDAAIAALQGAWRMPTKAEWKELIANCTWTWMVQDHVWGYQVEAANGNSIFLPAAGMESYNTVMLQGKRGYYWTSTLGSGDSKYSYCMKFGNDDYSLTTDTRYMGASVRAVCPAPAEKCTLTIVINGGTKQNLYIGYPGQTVTIKAAAETTSNFDHWNDGNTDNPRTFTFRGDAIYTAYFGDENATDLFEGGASNKNWEDANNWKNDNQPTATTNVTINDPVVIGGTIQNPAIETVTAIAQNLEIAADGDITVKDGANLTITEDLHIEAGGNLTIEPGATVRIDGTIDCAQEGGIVIQSDENGVGTLIVSTTEEVHPYGSVQLYTIAKQKSAEVYQWQHFGIPTMAKPTITKSEDVATYYYSWYTDEGWMNKVGSAALTEPFVGHNLTNASTTGGVVYTFSGQLVGNKVDTMKFASAGWALLANSYTVPMSIKAIFEALPDGAMRSIQIYNPIYGSNKANYMQSVTLGEINKGTAAFTELLPMQAFFVLASGQSSSTLNYKSASGAPTGQSNAPKRAMAEGYQSAICIEVVSQGEEMADDGLKLYELSGTSASVIDRSEDAVKQMQTDVAQIYAVKKDTALNTYCVDDLTDTYIAFTAGEATSYTLKFKNLSGTTYDLYDQVEKRTVTMSKDASYTFSAEANSTNAKRFVVQRKGTTAIDEQMGDEMENGQVVKLIRDGQLVIIKNGLEYNAFGAQIR